ncbi:AAA family ATPase [Leptospira santarosai]|uniref:AAA family ATPase n=1 Tax=Leptospira santarosai TaxID=28183 RepID=UPI0002BDF6E9|nr:ATP-binding protein [Leptospira santarosai]EMP03420.1 AAA domain protein [Leptospira santarosai str. HAI1380]
MIISKVKLTNWKNFREAEVRLTERIFIVGANASGKSNFLDVFRFLRDIVKQAGGLQFAVENRDGVSKIRCLSGGRIPGVTLEVHLSDEDSPDGNPRWIYSLSFKHSGGGIIKNQASIVEEKVFDGEKNKWILERKTSGEKEDLETLRFTYLEQVNSNIAFREIYHFFQEIQYLHIVPQLIRDSNSYQLSANKEDFYGRNLLEKMNKTSERTRSSYLKLINEFLQKSVPQLTNISFVKDRNGIPHLEAIYEHWRARGAKQRESQFSDGTLRLIGFMWALLDTQGTFLLEEPELYLHSAIVKLLPEFISKLQRRKGKVRQVIISTHSYEILSNEGISGDETIVLIPTEDGTEIKRAMEIEEIKSSLDAEFNMAEAVIPRIAPKGIHKILEIRNN